MGNLLMLFLLLLELITYVSVKFYSLQLFFCYLKVQKFMINIVGIERLLNNQEYIWLIMVWMRMSSLGLYI